LLPPLAVFFRRLRRQLIAAISPRQLAARLQKLAALQPLEHNPQTFAAHVPQPIWRGMQRNLRITDMFAGIFTLGLVGFIVHFAF
jgi:hypothetical protein